MKKNERKYTTGCLFVFIFALLCAAMFFLPLFGREPGSTLVKILCAGNIYSAVTALLALVPLAVIFAVLALPFDVIKKYVISCFMSLWLLAGEIVLCVVLKSKYPGLGFGVGSLLGIASAALLLVSTLLGTAKDKSKRSHKELVWYNGFNKIILIVSLPTFVCITVIIIMFFGMIFSFSPFIIAGVISAWLSSAICAVVSVSALFAKYKLGILHYVTAFLSVIAMMGIVISSSVVMMIAGLLVSIVIAAFWMFLGNVARKNFF